MREINYILESSEKFLSGKQDKIKLALCNFLAKGHTLIEDLPGVGKTTLVKFFSEVFDLKMSRIQFTNDLLPSDIIGAQIFNRSAETFHFHPGPIFGEIIMADELNRAPPKTQSALLQAMEEKRVNVENKSLDLGPVFHVIATQNPRAQIGTFDLPESQLDRFSMKLEIGYPDERSTLSLLRAKSLGDEITISEKISKEWIFNSINESERTHISDDCLGYIYRLLELSRQNSNVLPLSNRCGIDLVKTSKALAWMDGEKFVTPDHIKELFPYVAGHRLAHPSSSDLNQEREFAKELLSLAPVRNA